MQRKLKSAFRRSSKSKGSPDQYSESNTHHGEATSPRSGQHRVSSDRHGRTSVDSFVTGTVYTGRSRPVSSIYDDRSQGQTPGKPTAVTNSASHQSSDPNGGAIANDYKAYLPVLSPVDDFHGNEYIAPGGENRHDEDVTDRNIARHRTSMTGPARHESVSMTSDALISNQMSGQQHSRKELPALPSAGTGGPVGNRDTSRGMVTNGTAIDGNRSHAETSTPKRALRKKDSFPPGLRAGNGLESRKPQVLDRDSDASGLPQETYGVQGTQSGVRHATIDGTAHGEETDLARRLREDGVVDLRNTVHTDGDVTWAPAVTHEVIKPHQHEIVQHKIYREIHNYEYFHRIQPVMMTEVLPPRHWIPNPEGEGLIEISADELPARTGENRWWSICEHSSPYSLQKAPHKYRTEPEIIEAGTFMTEGGFERKETIIIHPPKLADLTGYAGPVQTVHFDHKTGERWMGELTTMDQLHELQRTLDRAPDAQAFQMNGLSESLPKVSSNSIPPRKPVSGYSPTVHSSTAGRRVNVA